MSLNIRKISGVAEKNQNQKQNQKIIFGSITNGGINKSKN